MPSTTLSHARLVVGGVAQYLADRGLAAWDDYGNGEPYDADTTWPVFIGPDVPTSPHRLIVLTFAGQTFDRADIETRVQVRLRSLPDNGATEDPVDELYRQAQAIHDTFYPNGFPLVHARLGAVRVGKVTPGDTLPLDPDAARRSGIIQNFRIRSRRPRPGNPSD